MRRPLALFALSAAVIVAAWWWLGAPRPMPSAPLGPGEKLDCVSYAPFRDGQSPLEAATRIEPRQIEEDLARLARITKCVRTYSVDQGLDQIASIAKRHGLQVMQGLWLSSVAEKNREQVATAVALAKQFPDVIRAVVVGNEVLLRGEMRGSDLAATIRAVKAQVPVPVTYADVWEFWLRHREVYDAVDFVTIHILPYWEDFPIPAQHAATHVDSIRRQVVAAFPGKEVFIGETGWPSAGRMREGALPSPVNQAQVIQDVLAAARQGNYRVNVIEAFDQPWKRRLEGTVGGHWGLLDGRTRDFKFAWGAPVSNHPAWPWQAAGGVVLAGLVFGAALYGRRQSPTGEDGPGRAAWAGIAASAIAAGICAGWAIENVPLESLGIGGWLRSLALVAVCLAAPLAAAAALGSGRRVPALAAVLARSEERERDPLTLGLGLILAGVTVLALEVSLGLVFDPRYRDFPFAPLTAAVVPLAALMLMRPRAAGRRPPAETVAAAVFGLSAVYIGLNEALANWQAQWFCALIVLFGVSLLRQRDVPG